MARNINEQILEYANAPTGTYPVELLHINIGTNQYTAINPDTGLPEAYDPDLYLTTCYKNLKYTAPGFPENEYIASQSLLSLSTIEETKDVKTNAVRISLGAVPNTIIAALNQIDAIGGRVIIHQGFFDENQGGLYTSPNGTVAAYEKWQGIINSHTVDENNTDGTVQIDVEAKSIVGTILNTKSGRFTSENSIRQFVEQDRSAEFVPQMVDFNPFFGREE